MLVCAKKLLDCSLPIEFQIDAKLSMLACVNKIKIYGCRDYKLVNCAFPTNIQFLNAETDIYKEIAHWKDQN